ncbi:SPOR domain-containing protein [Methylopila turkensis]|nr:SPOR domain-containing protein [Methylopila turkensis]
MQNQAMRRGVAYDGRDNAGSDDYERYANDPDLFEGAGRQDLGLRGGHHYDAHGRADPRYVEMGEGQEPVYDPRAYAPNPDEPYDYDADGNPVFYEPERSRGGRTGLMLVAAVVGVAMLGAGGVLAYRSMGAGGAFSGEPPLIKAETEPVKTVPDNPGGAEVPHQNKQIYDRVGGEEPQKSKVVSRQEEPVDLPASSAPARNSDIARVILPGGPASVEPTPPSTMGSEPRRVKTVEITPDTSYDTPTATAPVRDPIAEMARSGEPPVSEFDNGIMSDAPARAETPAPRPQAAAPTPTPRPAPAPAARPSATPAPALAPQQRAAQPAPAPQAPREQQVAAAAAPRAATPAAPAATTARGGFVVQVTSQRSDAEARAAYAALQRKYPQVLGSYSASIQTATVGDRGTYYRVRVGPFADGAQASSVCSNLRAAGGDCVVSRN